MLYFLFQYCKGQVQSFPSVIISIRIETIFSIFVTVTYLMLQFFYQHVLLLHDVIMFVDFKF